MVNIFNICTKKDARLYNRIGVILLNEYLITNKHICLLLTINIIRNDKDV